MLSQGNTHLMTPIQKFENIKILLYWPDDTLAMSSANGLVGTGYASRYRLQPRVGF